MTADLSTRDRLAALARAAEDQLRELILPFWLGLRDNDRGGFAGGASSRGRVLPSAAKGAVLQSRILWFFSSAYLRFGEAELLEAARLAYRFIADRLIDPEFGGVYWTVDAQGHAADTRKHVYAQAFAIYGLAAFHLASGDPVPLALARSHSPGLGARASGAGAGIADGVLQRALGEDGGLATGYDIGGVLDPGRVWWVQAEALVGFVDAFERHGDERFLTAAERVWDFVDRCLVDRVGGEWRWRIDPGASVPPVLPKVHLWKGPYHNGRACMELIDRAARMAKGGV